MSKSGTSRSASSSDARISADKPIVRQLLGVLVIGVAAIALPILFLTLIDPVGAKLSDDNDPFGPPPSRAETAIAVVVTGGLSWVGLSLVRGRP